MIGSYLKIKKTPKSNIWFQELTHLGYGLGVCEALREARVGVGAVWVGLWRVLERSADCIGNVRLLQPRARAGPLPYCWRGARLRDVGTLGSLFVLVPEAAVAPLTVWVVDLLAV